MCAKSCFNIKCEYFLPQEELNCGVVDMDEPPEENCDDFVDIGSFSDGHHTFSEFAWSRSMSEEVIGSLWCIVAILAYGFDVTWLMWAAGLKAGSDQLISIYFAAKEIGFVERERAKHEGL